MTDKFKIIPLDYAALVLTILAFIFHNVGCFAAPWWINENAFGTSQFGIVSFTICEAFCMDRSVLDIDGGREWVFAVRVFEVFGEICLIVSLILVILTLIVRRRPIVTALIYFHAAAAVFIIIGVLMFLGFQSTLNKDLNGEDSLNYTFALCLVGGLFCTAASVVSGVALKKHLLNPIWDDDDDDDDYNADLCDVEDVEGNIDEKNG
ncbi:hypothetical protein ACF0H5_016286 [Mactra antiquata]